MDQQHAAWVPGVNKAFETLCKIVEMDAADGMVTSAVRAGHIVFEADRYSITTYGRPLYGEHWTGSWMGPRPAVLSGLLSGDPMAHAMLSEADAIALHDEAKPIATYRLRAHNPRKLSESDVESLEVARAKFAGVTDAQAVREYSQHHLVLQARGGVIHARDMGTDEDDREHLIDLESEMPYIHFGD